MFRQSFNETKNFIPCVETKQTLNVGAEKKKRQ